jgi:hypothetical protein
VSYSVKSLTNKINKKAFYDLPHGVSLEKNGAPRRGRDAELFSELETEVDEYLTSFLLLL